MVPQSVFIPCPPLDLEGDLTLSQSTPALVIFVHGSGSSRHSVRNRYVAERLNTAGIGTLLFDLLTAEEDMNYANRFNIPLLTERLLAATAWVRTHPQPLTLGYFGASTGAAAALRAAAKLGPDIRCVVSRGGRPDLATAALPNVKSPTLLIVGEADPQVLTLNERAYDQLRVEKELVVIPHATHLFEEPGALDAVTDTAIRWFQRYLLPKNESDTLSYTGEEQSLD